MKNPMGLIEFTLSQGEKITAEAAAMVFMKGDILTETKMRKGGFLKSLKAAAFGGESFFVNEFIAQEMTPLQMLQPLVILEIHLFSF